VQQDNTVLFLTDIGRYIKFEVIFDFESSLDEVNYLLLVQIQIDEIANPIITDHARNVLSKFPSWTKMYSDSLEKATPSMALPDTVAGKVVNALLGEDLDQAEMLLSKIDLDSHIGTADKNQIAWIYVCTPVRPGFIKIVGDGVELSRVDSYYDLLNLRFKDYTFYYDFINQRVYTIRPFTTLYADTTELEQIEIQNYNSFDELGAKVGLQRLYLESNSNFKARIIDVYKNPPSTDVNGLKLTLRRELDIWRAYGSTPIYSYVGATPEILEISDLQSSTPYADSEGNPTSTFYNFVEDINKRFPSNYGYAKWEESYWDYAGTKQEGVSSIPQITDVATVDSQYYQAGIGDFDDAKILLEKLDESINTFSFGLKLNGLKSTTTELAYEPLKIAYDTYIKYTEQYPDNQYATINYDVYLNLAAHGKFANPSTFKANITNVVKNNYDRTHTASPEYIVQDIFNSSRLTESNLRFIDTVVATPYFNTINPSATESYSVSQIPLYVVDSAKVVFVQAKNAAGTVGDHGWIRFADATPSAYAASTNVEIQKSSVKTSPAQTKLAIASKIYDPLKTRSVNSPKVRSSEFGNTLNDSSYYSQTADVNINVAQAIRNVLLPFHSTPNTVHIDGVAPDIYENDLSSSPNIGIGGVALNRQDGFRYLIPASPNIETEYIVSGSTVNGYLTNISFNYNATPNYINVKAKSNSLYPFVYKVWEKATADYNGDISFVLSKDGVIQSTPDDNYDVILNKTSDLVGSYSFKRSKFGLSAFESSENFKVTSVDIVNNNNLVDIWQETSFDAVGDLNLNYFDSASGIYTLKDINVKAAYTDEVNKYLNPSMRSGWYYQNNEERYIYVNEKVEYKNFTAGSTLDYMILDQTVTSGAPVIVNINSSTPYQRVSFFDEATPSDISYYNYEYIKAKDGYTMYLAYEDVFDLQIVDTVTGKTVVSDLEYKTNKVSLVTFGAEPAFVKDRMYKVTYRVRNAYVIDNQFYDEEQDDYFSKVILLSTPNGSFSATVSYEAEGYDKDITLNDISLNPLYSPLDGGYLFISHDTYAANALELILSPKEILPDGIDYINLNIFSKDNNGNPKPYQTFFVSGSSITCQPAYVTTDKDGFGTCKITYNASTVNTVTQSVISVQGLTYPSANAHSNSSSGSISSSVNFYIKPKLNPSSAKRLSSDTDKMIITADGYERINIFGKTDPGSKIYWRKSRSVYQALRNSYSTNTATPGQSRIAGMVTANTSGQFEIGPFIAQEDATPGYWFVVTDTESASTPSATPVTIAGDIVYWYEKYDAKRSISRDKTYIPTANNTSDYLGYSENSFFVADAITGDTIIDQSATVSWNIPSWYPIKRYSQYTLGILGSTPNIVSDYSKLHPDYEEE
jgi:hypothetical protein